MKLPVTKDIELAQLEVQNVVIEAQKVEVIDNDSFVNAGDILKKVVTVKKNFKAKKDLFTKPAKDIIAQAKELFDPIIKEAEAVEKILKGTMLEWQNRIEAERAEKEARLEARVEKGTMRLDTAIRKAGELETADTAAAGVSKSVVRKVRLVNRELVPDHYWFLDMAAVRRDALGNKAQGIEPIEIPGIEVYEENALGMR